MHILLSFLVENLENFPINADVHDLNTRSKYGYMPNANLTKHVGVHYFLSSYSIIFNLQLKFKS